VHHLYSTLTVSILKPHSTALYCTLLHYTGGPSAAAGRHRSRWVNGSKCSAINYEYLAQIDTFADLCILPYCNSLSFCTWISLVKARSGIADTHPSTNTAHTIGEEWDPWAGMDPAVKALAQAAVAKAPFFDDRTPDHLPAPIKGVRCLAKSPGAAAVAVPAMLSIGKKGKGGEWAISTQVTIRCIHYALCTIHCTLYTVHQSPYTNRHTPYTNHHTLYSHAGCLRTSDA
jgi:hypothetical protein